MISYCALRAALSQNGSLSDRIDQGIDALRSKEYHAAVEIWKNACALHPNEKLPAPRVERVSNATEIREWLKGEISRILSIRQVRATARSLPDHATLRVRCEARVRRAVREAYNDCGYRRAESAWAGGDHTLQISVTGPSAVGETVRVWSANKKWSGNNSEHRVGVPLNWIQTVQARGIAVVDGLLTLEAIPCADAQPGEEIFNAQWVKRGRGCTIHRDHGVIYRIADGEWQHAATVKAARVQATKRLAAIEIDRKAREARLQSIAVEIENLRSSGLTLNFQACRDAGLCATGIEDWCAKRRINASATFLAADLLQLAIVSSDRVDHVRRAISLAQHKQQSAAA